MKQPAEGVVTLFSLHINFLSVLSASLAEFIVECLSAFTAFFSINYIRLQIGVF